MRAIVQRVTRASVTVDGEVIGKIDQGFLVLVGVKCGDTEKNADFIIKKCCGLRVFEDADGKMNLSLSDIGGSLLIVPNFTLYADCKKGFRPGFSDAAPPEEAERLYNYVVEGCRQSGICVQTGSFGADMKVELLNDGPITLFIENEG